MSLYKATARRRTATAVGIGAAALALAACSSGSGASSTVTVTATPTTAATPAPVAKPVEPAATKAALTGLPTAPAGSTLVQSSNANGVQYARYANSTEQPDSIVSYYSAAWQKEGYTITNTGSGGGGYGKYGGADAGATGTKAGSYVNVQAGGSTQGPTYFEVCQGANQSAVNECGNQSNSGSS